MVLDSYGKKSDLPIFNKFNPRRQLPFWKQGRTLLCTIVILCLFFLFKRNTYFEESSIILEGNGEGSSDNHELYIATKDGISKVDLAEDTLEEDPVSKTVEIYDLNSYRGSGDGLAHKDIILFLMPLRNAEHVLAMAFHNIMNLTYDHSLIDIAFLVSDCSPKDRTLEKVFEYSVALQNGTLVKKLQEEEMLRRSKDVTGSADLYQQYMDQGYMNNVKKSYNPSTYHSEYQKPFRSVTIFRKDFGQVIGQGFSDRHAVKVQGIRRKLMGRARNWLTSVSLKPYHSWVYWRDVDIETAPGSIIQDLMKHDYDVVVPNVWRPLPTFLGTEQPYDLNSWIESDVAIELAKTLDEEDVIVEGYAEYPTYRWHLAYERNPSGNPDDLIDIDGVGGVSILARAQVFRHGVNFPAYTFMNHAETEAFGKMAKKLGFRVGGLPHYTVWHIYEPSEDDLKQIAKLERKKRRKGDR